MAITLDSYTYYTANTKYAHTQTPFHTTRRTLTGVVDHVESGVFGNTYKITLFCRTSDITNLRNSFAKSSVSTNLLNFVDEEGFNWNPLAGANDSTHAYSTGVYFESLGEPKAVTARGWVSTNRFEVDITLVVNSSGISS